MKIQYGNQNFCSNYLTQLNSELDSGYRSNKLEGYSIEWSSTEQHIPIGQTQNSKS